MVDDDHDVRAALVDALTFAGYEVDVAASGDEALRALEEGDRPSLILLDLVMPEFDGFAVARVLRKLHVPAKIIALTAFTQPTFIETAEASGFDSVVAKPATADQLGSLLRH